MEENMNNDTPKRKLTEEIKNTLISSKLFTPHYESQLNSDKLSKKTLSNDILYQQISESVLKMMRKSKVDNLYQFLSNYELSNLSSERLKKLLDFNLDPKLAQRKLVQFGEIISRIISMQMVIQLGEKGFRGDLINNAIQTISFEIEGLMASVRADFSNDIVADYQENSNWSMFTSSHV
jgi:hypothetical protein